MHLWIFWICSSFHRKFPSPRGVGDASANVHNIENGVGKVVHISHKKYNTGLAEHARGEPAVCEKSSM